MKSFLSEKMPDSRISAVIREYYSLSDTEQGATRYAYNYIDLNDDGRQEIFVVVSGPYTSGSGGSSALLLEAGQDGLQVRRAFTLVHTPVIVTDEKQHGYKSLVVPYYGGGQPYSLSMLEYDGQDYPNVADGILMKEDELLSGCMLLADAEGENSFPGWAAAADEGFYQLDGKYLAGKIAFPMLLNHPGELTRAYANQSLRHTALRLYEDNGAAAVDYAVTCNTKKVLSVLYAAKNADAGVKLSALTVEMGRARVLTAAEIFKNTEDVAALTGYADVEQEVFFFTEDGVIFLQPAGDKGVYGYEAKKFSREAIRPYLKKAWQKKLW